MTMKKLFIGGLALALLVSASENAAAQEEKKMTRDEYVAQMADLTGREGTAKGKLRPSTPRSKRSKPSWPSSIARTPNC